MIRKEGNKYVLWNKAGTRKLGTYRTRAAAEKRERQIQIFKHEEEIRRKRKK